MLRTILVLTFIVFFLIIYLPVLGILGIIKKYNKTFVDTISQRILRNVCNVVVILAGIDLTIEGKENIPKNTPVLFVANHTSYFDIICTLSQNTGRFGYIAKLELSRIPSLRIWMHRINCIFLDRNDIRAGMQAILSAIDNIKNGISVFIFPEGTRHHDGKIHEFKGGSFKIATKTECPIIPVSIKGGDDVFEKHIPRVFPAKVHIKYGIPIYTSNLTKEESSSLPELVRNTVENMYLT